MTGLAHAARELRGRGEHVRQWICFIGKIVDVEEHGARYMGRFVFRARVIQQCLDIFESQRYADLGKNCA